jgi:hypothetical protein
MIKATVDVTEIERINGKKGEYLKIHYSDKKGPHKLAVFDPGLIAKFTGKGSYYIEVDKPDGSEYWQLKAAENKSNGGGGSPSTSNHPADDSARADSIRKQCAAKCAAVVLQGYAAGGLAVDALPIEDLTNRFFRAIESAGKDVGA